MSQTSPHVSWNGSRLVRFLGDLSVADAAPSHQNLTERLGKLIDLADSINLSTVHANLPAMAFEPGAMSGRAVTDEFLRIRETIIRSVISSFAPGSNFTRVRLPEPGMDAPPDEATAFEPYLKFYRAQQRNIDAEIRRLQLQVRESASGLNPDLARLCALDAVFEDTLAAYTRKCLAVVPRLLETRFQQILGEYRQDLARQSPTPPDWTGYHRRFCSEMQKLLLAEIETRQLPIVGLIEALDTDADKTHL